MSKDSKAGYVCPDATGFPAITTVAEARRYADVPSHHQYKCLNCGELRDIEKDLPYDRQSRCPRCGDQMMSGGWGGWYNRWRDLAIHLLENAVPEDATQLKEFAQLVKDMIRLQILDEDCTELRRQVYLLAHKYS